MACGKAGNAIQFVEQHDGVSFRHAFEVLAHGQTAAFAAQPLTKQSTVPRLPCPLDAAADDATLLRQVTVSITNGSSSRHRRGRIWLRVDSTATS
jgi:hypothetical protein